MFLTLAILMLALIVVAAAIAGRLRDRHLRLEGRTGVCVCGYSTAGLQDGSACPECGWPVGKRVQCVTRGSAIVTLTAFSAVQTLVMVARFWEAWDYTAFYAGVVSFNSAIVYPGILVARRGLARSAFWRLCAIVLVARVPELAFLFLGWVGSPMAFAPYWLMILILVSASPVPSLVAFCWAGSCLIQDQRRAS